MPSKSEFIRSLQHEDKPLSPFEISQRLRLLISCVSIYHGDPSLSVEEYRGYMVKFAEKPDRSPENPELYVCVLSLDQSKAWQDVVWIKEILHILDRPEHRTNTLERLEQMLDTRTVHTPNNHDTPLHVVADKSGFVLALGSAIPKAYRNILREQHYLERFAPEVLEEMLSVPAEFVAMVLDPAFEPQLEKALASAD